MTRLFIYVQLSKTFEFKIVVIFLPINANICFWCSKEPSHRDGSFDYPQHMFWLRNKKNTNTVQLHTLIWRLEHIKLDQTRLTLCILTYIAQSDQVVYSFMDAEVEFNLIPHSILV